MSSHFDAIVVGSGLNGLAAAVHLSAKGWRVLVLERQSLPGGAVKTAQCTLPGFRHDLYAMNLSSFAGSPFHAEHAGLLAQHGLSFIPADKPFASAFPAASGLPWVGVEKGLEATLAHVRRANPDDAARWIELDKAFDEQAPYLFGLLGTPAPSWAALKLLWRLYRGLGLRKASELVRILVSSPRDWLHEHFQSPSVHCMLASWGMHLDFGPDVSGGALFPYLEAMASQRFGMMLGQGGADTIIKAMVKAVEAAGGELRTESTVSRIIVESGRATGVELSNGQKLMARRAVIANVHPRALYGRLLGQDAPTDSAKASKLRPGPATMMIHLAMESLPDWRAGDALKQFAYVHLAPSLTQLATTYAQSLAGTLPAEPMLVVGQPTAFDPSRAPEGKHVLWVQVRTLPYEVQADAAGQLMPGSWDELKEAYADRMMNLLEGYAPGIKAKVLARTVLSPVDLERDNPNLVEGDSLSGSHHLDQFFMLRPAWGRARWRTGVDSLYHVGASTWPGGGTGAGSGYMLAREIA
ncbi:MAG: phytoene desaturase family protein [Pseudomonadota bacterium]